MKRQRLLSLTVTITLLFGAFVIVNTRSLDALQIPVPPGSAAQGAQLFQLKGCVECHSFEGKGGDRAPDLSQRSKQASTPALLASAMWDHSPAMWSRLALSRPTLTSADTADLFAYFYSQLYFNAPGDAARGKLVFEQKSCANCHVDGTSQKPSKGPPVSKWTKVKDPIAWADLMWNHSSAMQLQMTRAGVAWPQMSPQNMLDLMVYIRSLPAARSQQAAFQPGEPDLGRVVFERNCESCHSFGSRMTGKVDLLEGRGPRTLTDYVAAMWNHAPAMRRGASPNRPSLSPTEMTDLVGYLFSQRYFLEKGDIVRGARVYRQKNCYLCHEERRTQVGATDLTQMTEVFSPVTIASAVWRHGQLMNEVMKDEHVVWPEFHESEMSDLIAYLNSRLSLKMAARSN